MLFSDNLKFQLLNLKRFGPRISFIFNKFIKTKNYTISYFLGDHENMVSFASHVQQMTLGALFCNFNNYNFYSKQHPYFQYLLFFLEYIPDEYRVGIVPFVLSTDPSKMFCEQLPCRAAPAARQAS